MLTTLQSGGSLLARPTVRREATSQSWTAPSSLIAARSRPSGLNTSGVNGFAVVTRLFWRTGREGCTSRTSIPDVAPLTAAKLPNGLSPTTPPGLSICITRLASSGSSRVAHSRTVPTMRPFSTGVYVNELGDEGEEGVRQAYNPTTFARLASLKALYDPGNLFHLNQNIKPGAG